MNGEAGSPMTEAEAERLMSDPRIRELQYKLMNGGDKFKLEVTNEKPQEARRAPAARVRSALLTRGLVRHLYRYATLWCRPTRRQKSR